MLNPLWKYASGGLLFLCVLLFVGLQIEKRALSKAERRIVELTELRASDRAAYEAAQKSAADENKAEVARIESEQQRITNDVQSNLNTRLERLRSELRNDGYAAAKGAAGSTGPSQGGNAKPGAAGQAGVCYAPEELLRAAENEERHDRLIDWVLMQQHSGSEVEH